ncbi:MAG: hypothetical protein DMF73_02830 [Acidobacteria bacterium]|nr:MAG: hypothetical protein DMF73_02830 [Acidobacteriota bacterium]
MRWYVWTFEAESVRTEAVKNLLKQAFLLAVFAILVPVRVSAQCSGERWPVKIGTDPDASIVNLNSPTATTVANLIGIATPKLLQDNIRQPAEKKLYVINATLKKYALMYDLDYHMVIADAAGHTMIAEIPSPNCVPAGSPFAAGIAHARAQFDAMFTATDTFQSVDVPVRITGVGFFDYLEGQSGQAPNGIELHPIIDITFDSTFTLSASPQSLTINQGTSGTSVITSNLSGPFNSSVALSVSGLPSGATASFNPSSITAPGSGSSTMTITVGAGTSLGTYNLVVNGVGGGQTHSVTINLTIGNGDSSTQQLLGNPGFENGSANPSPWTATAGVIDNSTIRAPHTGSWKAWLDGYGAAHTDTLFQKVSIPANVASATLSFWLHIDTKETTATAANDTLQVQIRNSTGAVLGTLANYSNLNPIADYSQVSFDVSSYQGQTIQVYLVGTENGSLQTSFIVDDFALNVKSAGGPAGDFAISASPTAISMSQSSSSTSTVTTTISGNFSSAIALSASGLPAGATANFSPASIAAPGSGSSTLTFLAGSATPTGTYNVIVTLPARNVSVDEPLPGAAILGNPGFENGSSNPSPWSVTAGVIDNSAFEAAHSGSWKAWLNGYGSVHTDTLLQSVTIPSTATNASLSFWLHIDTTETTTTNSYDTLKVQVRNSSGSVLATLATYSNLNAATGFAQASFDLGAYKGQAIQLYLVGVEDSSLKTSFVVDDFALNVTTP